MAASKIFDFECSEMEYKDDILGHLRQMDDSTRPTSNFMDLQPQLDYYMRPYLLDFLLEIHTSLRLSPHTHFLAVNIVDRYTSVRIVYKKNYQLVGCAALWIASKFEDTKDKVPTVKELVAMCGHTYDQTLFVQMEKHIIDCLGYNIGHASIETFLDHFLMDEYDEELLHVARYLAEHAIYHREFLGTSSRLIALACIHVASNILYHEQRIDHLPVKEQHVVLQYSSIITRYLGSGSKVVEQKYTNSRLSHASQIVHEFVERPKLPPIRKNPGRLSLVIDNYVHITPPHTPQPVQQAQWNSKSNAVFPIDTGLPTPPAEDHDNIQVWDEDTDCSSSYYGSQNSNPSLSLPDSPPASPCQYADYRKRVALGVLS